MSQTIGDFLSSKISDEIKKKKNNIPKMDDLKKDGFSEKEAEEIINIRLAELENESKDKYSPRNWFLNLNENLHRLSLATHVGKYTHPAVKEVSLQNHNLQKNKKYLCNGSFHTLLQDYMVNAAYLPYVKTLEAYMPDGRTVREHLQEASKMLKEFIGADEKEYQGIQNTYRELIEQSKSSKKSDHRLKQVYFPLENNKYRLLTLIPCSALIWELKKRVDSRQWNQEEKKQRVAYIDYVNREYGGTKPQNISYLNNENGGNSILLKSFPPNLKRDYKLPISNFFTSIRIYRPKYFSPQKGSLVLLFDALHANLVYDPNALWARKKKEGIIRAIIERAIILPAEIIRQNASPGWSLKETYSALPAVQKVWLDPIRPKDTWDDPTVLEDWHFQISNQISNFITSTLQRLIKTSATKEKIDIDDPFSDEIASIAMEYFT